MTYFFSHGSSFFDSHASGTFYLMPSPWQISLYTGWVFSTHAHWAHFILYLRHSEFLFIWVWFSQLMHFRHILPCAFIVTDFSLCESSFFNLHTSGTFYFVMNFSSYGLEFFNSYTLDTFSLTSLSWLIFFFMQVEFSWVMCLRHILSCFIIVMNFSLCGLGFLDSCALGTFYFMPPSWCIYLHMGEFFWLMHLRHIYLVPPLWRISFQIGWFSQFMYFKHILSCASIMINFFLYELGFPNSCVSDIFYLVPPLWQISLYVSLVFPTYASSTFGLMPLSW